MKHILINFFKSAHLYIKFKIWLLMKKDIRPYLQAQYHKKLVDASVKRISNLKNSETIFNLGKDDNWFIGVISNDWLERINAKIAEKENEK